MYRADKILMIGAAAAAGVPAAARTVGQPHIILIVADQFRGDCLGAVNPHIHTSNLDRLAAEGTLFTHAYSSVPSSTPARAGLLTGLAPWHHGMLGYGRVAEHYRYEMPRMLGEAGYYTFGIGKMHWFPQKTLHGFNGTLVDESGRIEQDGFVSDYRDWFKLHAPGINPDTLHISWNSHYAAPYPLDERLHPTAWTAQTAIEMIDAYALGDPLFLKVSFARPHSPYDPPERFVSLYDGEQIPLPYRGAWSERFARPEVPETSDACYGDFGDSVALRARKYYYASISFIDYEIGRIVEALKEKGIYDDCLIIFLSDHGDMLGDHNHWRKTYPYEGSARIPFIVRLPTGMRARCGGVNERRSQVVELRDVLPTMLEAAGCGVPDDMDGRSVLGLIADPGAPWREYIDLEHAQIYEPENCWMALTDGRRKYIRNARTGEEQLFDLENDPGECRDLAGEEQYAAELRTWRTRLTAHLAERDARYVRNGELQIITEKIIYSPNYPGSTAPATPREQQKLREWRREATAWR